MRVPIAGGLRLLLLGVLLPASVILSADSLPAPRVRASARQAPGPDSPFGGAEGLACWPNCPGLPGLPGPAGAPPVQPSNSNAPAPANAPASAPKPKTANGGTATAPAAPGAPANGSAPSKSPATAEDLQPCKELHSLLTRPENRGMSGKKAAIALLYFCLATALLFAIVLGLRARFHSIGPRTLVPTGIFLAFILVASASGLVGLQSHLARVDISRKDGLNVKDLPDEVDFCRPVVAPLQFGKVLVTNLYFNNPPLRGPAFYTSVALAYAAAALCLVGVLFAACENWGGISVAKASAPVYQCSCDPEHCVHR